jgi:RimJ/RimL family protein N-acetyltransferase
MIEYHFRKAKISEIPEIWDILELAIKRRKEEGSDQWQDGYPNPAVVEKDIEKEAGFVLTDGEIIVGYCAVLINDEPEYSNIEGKWLSYEDFVVFHRVAISEKYLGKGCAQKMIGCIENFAIQNNIHSVKADTNFDNSAMMKVFEKLDYTFCGHVYFRGGQRKAYEKVLEKSKI